MRRRRAKLGRTSSKCCSTSVAFHHVRMILVACSSLAYLVVRTQLLVAFQ